MTKAAKKVKHFALFFNGYAKHSLVSTGFKKADESMEQALRRAILAQYGERLKKIPPGVSDGSYYPIVRDLEIADQEKQVFALLLPDTQDIELLGSFIAAGLSLQYGGEFDRWQGFHTYLAVECD